MLASLDTDNTATENEQNFYVGGVASTNTKLNDDMILNKLAAMNTSLFKTDADDTNLLNFGSKPGTVNPATRCNTYTNKGLNHAPNLKYLI
jgi:hypothetical protein